MELGGGEPFGSVHNPPRRSNRNVAPVKVVNLAMNGGGDESAEYRYPSGIQMIGYFPIVSVLSLAFSIIVLHNKY